MTDWLQQLQFLQPAWLGLAPLLLLGLYAWHRSLRPITLAGLLDAARQRQQHFRHPDADLLESLATQPASWREPRQWSCMLALLAGLALVSLALAQPVLRIKTLPKPPEHRDILFIVDTSLSMQLRDYYLNEQRIDRMTLLKGILSRFVERLPHDRLSIVVYGESAHTLAPLTFDHALVQHMITRIHTGLVGRGNGMGDALAMALHSAGDAPGTHRLMLVFSDGARLVGDLDPIAAAEIARQRGIRVHTIGIGAATEAAQEQKISGLVYQPANIERLEAIARQADGRFFWAGDTDSLNQVLSEIERMERTPAAASVIYVQEAMHGPFILAGAVCLILAQLLYRGRRRPA